MGPGGEATHGCAEVDANPVVFERASEQVAFLTGFRPWSMTCHEQDVDPPEVSTPLQLVD